VNYSGQIALTSNSLLKTLFKYGRRLSTVFGCLVLLGACQPSSSLQIQPPIINNFDWTAVSQASGREILLRLKASQTAWSELRPINPSMGLYSLHLAPGQSLSVHLQNLKNDPRILYAEPNYTYQLAPLSQSSESGQDFQIKQTIQETLPPLQEMWNLKSAQIPAAWKILKNLKPLTVAVIDSGVDPDHPLLKDRLLPLEDLWGETQGKDILRSRSNPDFIEDYGGRDGNGHGTHIAGIIHIIANQAKADGPVKILPIKATNMAGATNAQVLTLAFQRAMDKGAKVINISIGTVNQRNPAGSQALQDMIQLALDRGIAVVGATGNESQRQRQVVARISAPAFYEGLIAVGAITDKNDIADYSNGGPEIELVAPGGNGSKANAGQQILSTWPTYRTFDYYQGLVRTLGLASTSGTSMAAPHVTGTVALLLAQEPLLSPSQIRARLMVTADDLSGNSLLLKGFDQSSGWGKLNALQALSWKDHDSGK
jgi:subtilisin family serine protease